MKHRKANVKLDDYEKEISDAIDSALEHDTLKSVPNLKEEKQLARAAASNFIRKNERITVRVSSGDLNRLKQEAAYKGLPYQTFISSVLHQYASGHFVEVKSQGI